MTVQRIAILLPDLRGGGAERVSLILAAEFLKRGHAVDLVLMQANGELIDLVPQGARVVDLEKQRLRGAVWSMVRYLRRERPDTLLAAMWPLTVVAPLVRSLSRLNPTVVVSEHSILSCQYAGKGLIHSAIMRTSMAVGYRWADARVGVSSGVSIDMAKLAIMDKRWFAVVNNPVSADGNPDGNSIVEAEGKWGSPRGRRIITVGRLKSVKNHALLLHAFSRLSNENDARLLIVGDGEEKCRLQCLANDLDIADRVIFAGFHSDPTPFYQTADLFVLSSNYEGFGNVLVESLAQGLPVVSTDCPSGPTEILEGGRYGRLVPVGNVEALARAMSEALDAEHDREALKRRAADFAPEIAAKKYLDLLFPQ